LGALKINETIGLKGRLQISSCLNETGLPCCVPQTARPACRANSLEASMFHLLWMAVIGLIVGALAKLIMPGKDPGGIIVTMLLGIAGALLAGWLGQAIGWYKPGEGAGFIMSLIGALILLFIYRLFKGKRAATT
jgi:uncharacterized membrane protein YeaQ/YmgE (transglycosylase-associated protein family)